MTAPATTAEVVVETREFDGDLAVFLERAGFRLDAIFPADDPSTAIVSRGGVRVRLRRADADRPVHVHVSGPDVASAVLGSPGGSTIETAPADAGPVVPDNRPTLVISRSTDGAAWVSGRAGMRYRELLPGRWGGRFIASHIHIPEGGPVPDYVHYHRIRFQMIVVKAGWVEVVYEDQGPPFVLEAGDAVLQPPEIRHRVVHSSPDLEVVEIGCPAEHMTLVDHELSLPTPARHPDRDFGGQRFARSILAAQEPHAWIAPGFRARDTGFAVATDGLVGARIVEPDGATSDGWLIGDAEFAILVVLDGSVGFEHDGPPEPRLGAGDSVALPAGHRYRLVDPSPDLRLLDVTVPAAAAT